MHSPDKAYIKRILEENDIFGFDSNLNIWKIVEIEKNISKTQINFYDFDFNSQEQTEWNSRALTLIDDFTKKYPISKIKDLTIDEYVIAPKGVGKNDSFCKMLRYDLQMLCSMGNVFPTHFEIYKKFDNNIYLSPTYSKEFGSDLNAAFVSLKERIYNFLLAAEKEDVETMRLIALNGVMKRKLCSVYFHNQYFMGGL